MTLTEAIAIRSAQLSGKPIAIDEVQVAMLMIALSQPIAKSKRPKQARPRKPRAPQ